jgi:hypothetical protein
VPGGKIIKHCADTQTLRERALDGIEAADEFEVAMAWHRTADDGAG